MLNFRTDLAIEAKEHYAKEHKNEIDGVIVEEEIINDSKVTKVKIESEEGAKKLGKPIGNYITIDKKGELEIFLLSIAMVKK